MEEVVLTPYPPREPGMEWTTRGGLRSLLSTSAADFAIISIVLLAPLLYLAAAIPLQDDAPPPASPFDQVVELELSAEDPALIDGQGPTAVVEYEVQFEGTLHVWTSQSEIDLYLQVDDASAMRTLVADGDSGGGTTPYVELELAPGTQLAILVAGTVGSSGPLALHFAAAPENATTLAAAAKGREALAIGRSLASEGDQAAARDVVTGAIRKLVAAASTSHSGVLAGLIADLAFFSQGELLEFEASRVAWSAVLRHAGRTQPSSHRKLLRFQANFALSMSAQGDLAGARALEQTVLGTLVRTLPEDHSDVLQVRTNLAATMSKMGDLTGARVLEEAVLEALERTRVNGDRALENARMNLAITILELGELEEARTLLRKALDGYEGSLPSDHPAVLGARGNLALSLKMLGELAGARALEEQILEVYERTLPKDHPRILGARDNLAVSMQKMGDLDGAYAMRESVLDVRKRTLRRDHPDLLIAQQNLAVSMMIMGDYSAARVLQDAVLEARKRTLPESHPDLLRARLNLANTLHAMSDFNGAMALRKAVLEVRERTLPEGHPQLQYARAALAHSISNAGDHQGAIKLRQAILEACEDSLPTDHPDTLSARSSLALSMFATGDFAGALAVHEAVLEARERTLPEGHYMLLRARHHVAAASLVIDDLTRASSVSTDLMHGMRARLLRSLALAPRQTVGIVADEHHHLTVATHVGESVKSGLAEQVFELSETMRAIAVEAERSLTQFKADAELAPILDDATAIRGELNDLVAGAHWEPLEPRDVSSELSRLSLARDALERRARRVLSERGVTTRSIDIESLAAALGPRDRAVSFRRMSHWVSGGTEGPCAGGADHVKAQVLSPDGSLARLDLGRADELQRSVSAWRSALGAPLSVGQAKADALAAEDVRETRGIGRVNTPSASELEAGRRLRRQVLDPILKAAGSKVERIFVCSDDLLFLLPYDALPLEPQAGSAGRVGDALHVVNEVSFARLVNGAPPSRSQASLLALGGVAYGERRAVPESTYLRSACGPFADIPESAHEVAAIARLFEGTTQLDAEVLTEHETTKAALFAAAGQKRYVHIATHGWFAPESVKGMVDAQPIESERMSLEEHFKGFAPMTLCGLALAGANYGRDALGRVPGILTAEELCSLDLSQCELAVLSACETNVGIRRAGQGIQSLQAALYAAGTRASITSLWKVDDAATRRLFEIFYTNLWVKQLPKSEALWSAKVTLREEGRLPRDWAGWVLTGDPD